MYNNKNVQNSQDESYLAQNAIDLKCSQHSKSNVFELNLETKKQRNF